ncbi:hypothetical protein ACWD33_11460 [Streptomyces xiamenensis]|uniref:hypothetical protein n=1 Tax=Streptomyces xiamenensis TaxID=408015 RepID=UPI0035DB0C15
MLTRGLIAPAATYLIAIIAVPILSFVAWKFGRYYGFESVERVAQFVNEQWGKVPNEGASGRDPLFAAAAQLGLFVIALWVLWRTLRKGVLRKYWLTIRTCSAVVQCARAKRATAIDRPDRIRQVDSLCRAVEWSIWRSHLWRGGMTRRSPRRAAARQHAALVITALHRELDKLDVDPGNALDGLAQMLATIGEQHAAGQVAALLPAERLEGLIPVSLRRHAIRESLVVVRGIVAALGAALALNHLLPFLGVPNDLAGWFLAGGALAAAITSMGWQRVRDLWGIFHGS